MNRSGVVVIIVAALLGNGCAAKKASPGPRPPALVYVAPVAKREVPLYTDAVATLDGYNNADIRARVHGYLRPQRYKDGARVKAGDLLFTIEHAEYVASVASAKAALTRAKVLRDHNRIQLDRDQGLRKTGMLSQQDLDNASSSLADAEAQITSAEAALRTALLNLSYTEIHSPIEGVAGLALVRTGNLVGQDGPTLLTTVSQTDFVRVNFALSEVDYVRHRECFANLDKRDLSWVKKQTAKLDAGGRGEGGDRGVQLVLADGSVYQHLGVIVTANRQIDGTTGTIAVQALVPNPDGFLRPGQYAHARVQRIEAGQNELVVPEKALIALQGTYSVAVVGSDNKVQLRRVELGPAAEGLQIITSGLAEGDHLVVEGLQNVSDGAVVDPQPQPTEAAR